MSAGNKKTSHSKSKSNAHNAIKAMNHSIEALRQGAELDLVTIDFQECYIALKEILGEVSREDLLDAIFSNFCLGK